MVWLGWFAVLNVMWLGLVVTFSWQEEFAGVISAAFGATAAEAVQAQGLVNLWVLPEGNAAKAIRLPTGNIAFYSSAGNNLSWTPDGRIVFVSNEGGNADTSG